MLNSMLFQDIGQRLSKKPFEWMSWWWGIRWGAFIKIHPPLTEKTPLWQRDDASLKSIRLFGLMPHQLQTEITRYWEKPFWRRWLSRLFTSIESKITICSYYQRCLSFRDIQKQNPMVDQPLLHYEPEQKLLSILVTTLSQDNLALEQRLEKYSGNQQWIQKNFSPLLTRHENKRRLLFLRLMEKLLKKLPSECNRGLLRRELEKEYQELEKMLRTYLKGSIQHKLKRSEAGDNALVYVGSVVKTDRVVNLSFGDDLSCSMSSINLWVARRRQTIDVILQEGLSEEEQTNKVKTLLRESLNSLSSLIDPQIESYQRVVREAIQGEVNYREVIKWSELLQSSLLKLYRNGARLFHPDRVNGSVSLRTILTDLFQQFKQSSEASMEKIQQGQESLKHWFGHSLEWELRIRKLLKELAADRAKHSAYMEQKLNELDESIKEVREQLNAMDVKLKNNGKKLNMVEEECKINKKKAKKNKKILDANGKEIKKLTELVKQFLPISNNQEQEHENSKASFSLKLY